MARTLHRSSSISGSSNDNNLDKVILIVVVVAIILGFFILIMKMVIIAGSVIVVIGLLIAGYGYYNKNSTDIIVGLIIFAIGVGVILCGTTAISWAENDPTGRQMMQWGSDIRNATSKLI